MAPRKAITKTAVQDAELAQLCKALGHPARIQILRILADRAACICGDLVDALPLAQSTISQHLKILKDAGLVTGTVDGPRRCYCVSPAAIGRLKDLIAAL